MSTPTVFVIPRFLFAHSPPEGFVRSLNLKREPHTPCLLSIFAHMMDHHHLAWDLWFIIWSKIKQSWHLSQSLFVLPQICWDLGFAISSSKMSYIIYLPRCAQSPRLTPINHYNSQVTICTDAAQRIIPPLLARVTSLQSTVVCQFHLPRCHFTCTRCRSTWCTWGCGWWSIIMDRDHNLHHCRSLILLAEQKYRFLIIHSNIFAETPSILTQPCQPILHLINCSAKQW